MTNYQSLWVSQVLMLTPRPTCMFTNLRYLTSEIIIYTDHPDGCSKLLQLARYLEIAPCLEVLQLNIFYHELDQDCWSGEATGEELSCMCCLHHLKTVYMSGFWCYRPQVELLCGILEKGAALEFVIIEPNVTIQRSDIYNKAIPARKIRRWARQTSERYGKAIHVVQELPPDL